MNVIDIFENSVRRFQSRKAVTMRSRYRTLAWRYKDLARYANGVAHLLEREGVKTGDPVLLWAINSPYWAGAFFGILIRGGIVVPLHAENTPEFMETVSTQTGARVMLKSSHLKFHSEGLKTIDVDQLFFEGASYSSTIRSPSRKGEDLAEILYTSGTTGDPKGVMLTHGNIVSNIEALSRAIPIDCNDRFLSILPLSHMLEQTVGMLFQISRGAEIIYIPRVSSGLITKAMQECQVTKLLAVPQFLDTVMKKIEARAAEEGKQASLVTARKIAGSLPFFLRRYLFSRVHRRFGGHLTTVASGGAPLDPDLEKKWELLGIRLLQGYGLTETAPIVCANTYREHCFGSVGKPVEKVTVKIAPDGEVLVKGPNVFRGYYKDEEKTKGTFDKEGWFKTGDIGELDQNGFLFIRGRKKYVILGPSGQNVYSEDIEFELNKHPGVRDSVVVGLERDARVEIHAVLLLDEGINPGDVIKDTNKKIASFQRVQGYTVWPETDFPRSATRKPQKEKILSKLRQAAEETHPPAKVIAPLAALLGTLFNKDPALIHPDMLLVSDLLLDSIMRIELVTRIEEVFGVILEERDITQDTRVRDLEVMLNKAPRAEKAENSLKKWPFTPLATIIRELLYWILIYPLLLVWVRPRISGAEVFHKLKGPFLIMPGHRSFLDSPMMLRALPHRIRRRVAFAAGADVVRRYRFVVPFFELLFANFSFPREERENIEAGLEAVGKLLDQGWSIIIYPEGRVSTTKDILPLKRGAGLLGLEMGVPVIPVFLDGTEYVLPWEKIIPRRRGEVRVSFGKPLLFRTDHYLEATEKIERALHELRETMSLKA
ncbi:AMP-binding protein [candidate division TA06 bacterium]|nr:AMP-binding protein [candidate division TA06 bacterium]